MTMVVGWKNKSYSSSVFKLIRGVEFVSHVPIGWVRSGTGGGVEKSIEGIDDDGDEDIPELIVDEEVELVG
jgi:hypothetical protein